MIKMLGDDQVNKSMNYGKHIDDWSRDKILTATGNILVALGRTAEAWSVDKFTMFTTTSTLKANYYEVRSELQSKIRKAKEEKTEKEAKEKAKNEARVAAQGRSHTYLQEHLRPRSYNCSSGLRRAQFLSCKPEITRRKAVERGHAYRPVH